MFSDDPSPDDHSGVFGTPARKNLEGHVFDELTVKHRAALPRWVLPAAAAVVGLGALLMFNSHLHRLFLTIAALFFGGLMVWAARYTTLHPLWLATALVLVQSFPYLNLIPLSPKHRWPLHYPPLLLFCLPAIAVALKKGFLKDRTFMPLLLYFGWGAITVVYSLDPTISAGRLIPDVLLFGALALVALSTKSADDMRTVLWRFLLGCTVLLILNAFAAVVLPRTIFVQGSSTPTGIYTWARDNLAGGIERFEGVFSDPNEIGSLMLASVGVALSLWRTARRSRRVALSLIIAAALIFDVMADSRSAIVALAVGCAGYLLWKHRARGLLICGAVAIAGVLVYGVLGSAGKVRINRNISTLTGRAAAWRFEVHKILERPLRGYGYDVEGAIFKDPQFPNWDKFWNRGPHTPTHEGYLSIAVGMGLPALLFWLFVILRPWLSLVRRPDDPWNIKPLLFFLVLPLLCRAFAETGVGAVRGLVELVFYFAWMIAERQRVGAPAPSADNIREPSGAVDFKRLFAGAAMGLSALTLLMAALSSSAYASGDRVSHLTTQSSVAAVQRFERGQADVLGLNQIKQTDYTRLAAGPSIDAGSSAETSETHVFFRTLPPHAPLPNGQQCAAEIPPTPETIPGNTPFNHTRVTATALAAFKADGYTFENLTSYAQYARIKGNYAGSTDMIMRWVACKYGINENVVRAQAWQESFWEQWAHGDKRTTKRQCVQGHFAALWNTTISLVDARTISCPYCCYQSWSAWQTKVYYEWKTWPMIKDSTSFAGEYRYADARSCINGDWAPYFASRHAQPGHHSYAYDIAAYARNPTQSNLNTILWGCIGMHYSGGWYDAGALKYIADIKGDIAHRRWVTPNIHVSGP